jgi:hypothetical protein
VADVCKLYGVTKVFSAAYHSRSHGMVEILNRTTEDRLKHTTNQACDDWDVWLPKTLFAILSTPASGSKMSSFRLLYGRDPIQPMDNALLNPRSSSSMAQAQADRAITHAADHTRAASNTAHYHSRMKEHFNASRTPASLSRNDLVYAQKPDAKRGKFAQTWRGPYMIVGCHSGNNNYTLQTFIDQKVQQTTQNINVLCPFLDTDDSDKIDTSDALPFSTDLAVYYTDVWRRHDDSSQTARTLTTSRLEEQKEDDNTSYRVKHFENFLMQTDSGLNNRPSYTFF